MSKVPRNGLRLLSFDGGGARSLSQLTIMNNVMHRIKFEKKLDGSDPNDSDDSDGADEEVLPCDSFDVMGGSDTGGCLAVMFAKLGMSVKDAFEEFNKICNEVYLVDMKPERRTATLRKCVEDLLKRRGLPIDLVMGKDKRGPPSKCLCFVVAVSTANMHHKIKLRSYSTRAGQSLDVTVVDAILATCATQGEFLPITIGSGPTQQQVMGAAMGAGNPCHEVVQETIDRFKSDRRIAVILSLGSGHPGLVSASVSSRDDEWLKIMRLMAADCENTAHEMQKKVEEDGAYFRFSVEQGLQKHHGLDVDRESWVNAQTLAYLDDHDTRHLLDQCVEGICQRQRLIALEDLGAHIRSQVTRKSSHSLLSQQLRKLMAICEMGVKDIQMISKYQPAQLTLVDAIGNYRQIPFEFCFTHEMFTEVLNAFYKHQRLPGYEYVTRGDYQMVLGGDLQVVDPLQWKTVVKPESTLQMSMVLRRPAENGSKCPRCSAISKGKTVNDWANCSKCDAQFRVTFEAKEENDIISPARAADTGSSDHVLEDGLGRLPLGSSNYRQKLQPLSDEWHMFRLLSIITSVAIDQSFPFTTEYSQQRAALLEVMESDWKIRNEFEPDRDALLRFMRYDSSQQRWSCTFWKNGKPCTSSCKKKNHARGHVRAHIGHRPYACDGNCPNETGRECTKRYPAIEPLIKHRTGGVECPKCGRNVLKANMSRHEGSGRCRRD